ncbi:hypothetical protein [Dysgonomonas sp. ZJ279]|uniref:hypothetical protein n=1 Tax=Dysgonomonas sp. ZJ279 TaxID=2709796 RepID=UPI0013ECA53F|nr:hypothetical protein [Dysgonomonas sp. ZJ279]
MTTKSQNKVSHGTFWGRLKKTANYNDAYKENIKAAWVRKYSDEKTQSLNELYYMSRSDYFSMLDAMKKEAKTTVDRNDAQRKKLFSLIYHFCKYAGYKCDKEQAKKIACRACGVQQLNNAPEHKLIAVIKAFENNEADAWVSSVLKKVAEGEV